MEAVEEGSTEVMETAQVTALLRLTGAVRAEMEVRSALKRKSTIQW